MIQNPGGRPAKRCGAFWQGHCVHDQNHILLDTDSGSASFSHGIPYREIYDYNYLNDQYM